MYEIITRQDGVYGGRFCGAGFKGFCMAIVDPAYMESIAEKVQKEYLSAYPALADKYLSHVCETVNGVSI